MTLREKLTLRHYQPDDYALLEALIRAANTALGIETSVSAAELAAMIAVPEFDPRRDSFVFEHDGRVIAMSHQGFNAESGRCWSDAIVHPDYWGQGIGTELLRLTEARCLEWANAALTPELPLLLQLAASDKNARAKRLFEAQGYHIVRTFYEMRIAFDYARETLDPLDAPPLPNGLVLRPFHWERDARAVYEADMDAFADHWGFERDSFEEWSREHLNHPQTDFSLWLVAYAGDEIAGICLNRALDGDHLDTAWVWVLGVRRFWRRQGLGEALLKASFTLFRERGFDGAGLMVDSSNATNAVGLYERAGMSVSKRRDVYHKMLREAAPSALTA